MATAGHSHCVAENLVYVAQGEADESTSAVLIRDASAVFSDGGADIQQMPEEEACILYD